jgi:uncharacterized membrane protein
MIEAVLVAAILITCLVWYAQHRRRRRAARVALLRETAGLEVLATRYARGEIDRDEFRQKRDDILEGVTVPRA